MAEPELGVVPGGLESVQDIDQDVNLEEKIDEALSVQQRRPDAPSLQNDGLVKRLLVLFAMYGTALLYGLDTTITGDVQAAVLSDLGEITKLGWLGIGFPMGSVATILLFGVSYRIFNIKYLYLFSISLFEVGSAVCGSAQNMNSLIVGRVIAGIGGGGMYLGLLNYIAILTTERERPIYNGLIGLVWGGGAILGPVIGGAFADSSATWRWAFYINLVVAGISAPAYFLWLPTYNPLKEKSLLEKFGYIDWLGAVLNAAVFVLFIVVLTFAGITWEWKDGRVITFWVVFGVLVLCHVLQQRYSILTDKENRIFPSRFLLHRSMPLIFATSAASTSILLVPTYYLPLYFQFVHGDSAIEAAVRLLPFISFAITSVMASGLVLMKTGHYMACYLFSGVITVCGGALMLVVTPNTAIASVYGFSILLGVGAGTTFQMGYTVAANQVKPEEVPDTISFINVAQLGGGSIALSIADSIFQNVGFEKLSSALSRSGFSAADLHSALAGARSSLFTSATDVEREAAVKAIVSTMNLVFALCVAAGSLNIIMSFLMKREKLELKN